jgi:hypothetical protein
MAAQAFAFQEGPEIPLEIHRRFCHGGYAEVNPD